MSKKSRLSAPTLKSSPELFICRAGSAEGRGRWTDGRLVLLEGSTCRRDTTPTTPKGTQEIRAELLRAKTLVPDGEVLRLSANYVTQSPSQAASIVQARTAGGWVEWKTEDGRTLDQVVRRPVETPERFQGLLSRDMWHRVSVLDSKYPDTFDYGVYDGLESRYGDETSVIFHNNLKLLDAQDCAECFYRFEVDTYGRGCTHECAWCYSKSYLTFHGNWNKPQPFPIDISRVRELFHRIFETSKPSPWRKLMERRTPLRIGAMSDAFMHLDKKFGVTREFLKILDFYEYPALIATRSDLVAHDDYLRHMSPQRIAVQVSMSSINPRMTRQLEAGTPSPARRLAALKKLAGLGFWTSVRINPLFPIFPDGYYSNPAYDRSAAPPPFEYFSWDMVPTLGEHGAKTVLAGFARLYQPSVRFMNKALDWDVRRLFRPGTTYERAALHVSDAERQYYYERMKQQCRDAGMRFSVCYIGNDPESRAFEQHKPLWDNPCDCCDMVGNVRAFGQVTRPTDRLR